MDKRSSEAETENARLADQSWSKAKPDAKAFANSVARFFGRNDRADRSESEAADVALPSPTQQLAQRAQIVPKSTFYKHWDAIKADGITASQFTAFLQPLADLDGVTVSYTYSDEDGTEHVYKHKREDTSYQNPFSQAIRDKKLSKDKAMTFALNEEGKVWIESNFVELK